MPTSEPSSTQPSIITPYRLTQLSLVLVALMAGIGVALGWPLGRIALLLGGAAIVMGTLRFVALQRQLGPLRRLGYSVGRINAGYVDEVIDDLSARRDAGDRSPDVLMGLAAAYNYQGRGPAAAAEARDALAALTTTDTCGQDTTATRLLCETAHLLLFDARLAEGRYEEAADGLRDQLPRLVRQANARALAAWGYFLAGNDEAARAMLADVPVPSTDRRSGSRIDPRYWLVLAHLRGVVLDHDVRAELRAYQSELAGWETLAARNAHNPYGARLSAVLDDIRQQIAAPA